jgi:DNA-directed RNA polymerase specialized sigma24 family protein
VPGSSTLALLDHEWRTLAATPAARSALIRWGRRNLRIAGLRDLEELLELRRSDPAASAAILRTLATLAPGDALASRTLLQALIPGLRRLAQTAGRKDHGAIDELVSLAWERIRTYPDDRPGSVAANVLWDVRKRYCDHRRIDVPALTRRRPMVPARPPLSVEEAVLHRAFVHEIAAAQQQGLIPDGAFALIVRTRLYDEPIEKIAQDLGVHVDCLRGRRRRGERNLREHLLPAA